jgi:hypothetical protein
MEMQDKDKVSIRMGFYTLIYIVSTALLLPMQSYT